MNFPNELKYTAGHEWVRASGNEAVIGVTDFTQSKPGEIVYVDVDTEGERIECNEVFGSIEAVKIASDLMMPMMGKILEVNEEPEDTPELVNEDSYSKDWIIKVVITSPAETDELPDVASYQEKIDK